ncbi:hypothetical protein CLAIMM_13768 [Cladophialophora immunda]|nr:hypothetical protein CLAIMM_13768 [Cladophialophora immunda]
MVTERTSLLGLTKGDSSDDRSNNHGRASNNHTANGHTTSKDDTNGQDTTNNNDNMEPPTGDVAADTLPRYHLYRRRLALAWSAICLVVRLMCGMDKRLDKHTVRKLREIVWYLTLAILNAMFQSYFLPWFKLSVLLNFFISVGVSEFINSIVELGIGRHVRALGAALTTHIVEHVFGWIEEKTVEAPRQKSLALVKESLRKSDGPGNFLFAAAKGLQVSVSVFISVCSITWPKFRVLSIPFSMGVTAVFVAGLFVTQWWLSWENTESLNRTRSTFYQNVIKQLGPRAPVKSSPTLEAGPKIHGYLDGNYAPGADSYINSEAGPFLEKTPKIVADSQLSTSCSRVLTLWQRQGWIEVVRRHLLQLLVLGISAITRDIPLCFRLWRDCQSLDGVFQKFINSIAQQTVVF